MTLLLSTIALRPYVFVFLAAFLFIAIANFGVRTTILFALLTYLVALVCEWSSIHNGFPFGLYHYVESTRGREIWVAGVPLFDSLSFTFLAFASYTVALLMCSPMMREGRDLRLLDTWQIRRAPRVWLMAALFMVMVDTIADPLSVRGARWFLGRIFWYDPPGVHFGVPISNYLGWYFVAVISIAIFQSLDALLNRGGSKPFGAMPALPMRAMLGPALYFGIVGFGLTMLFVIGEPLIASTEILLYLPLIGLVIYSVSRADSYDAAARMRHLADFPYDIPSAECGGGSFDGGGHRSARNSQVAHQTEGRAD